MMAVLARNLIILSFVTDLIDAGSTHFVAYLIAMIMNLFPCIE